MADGAVGNGLFGAAEHQGRHVIAAQEVKGVADIIKGGFFRHMVGSFLGFNRHSGRRIVLDKHVLRLAVRFINNCFGLM